MERKEPTNNYRAGCGEEHEKALARFIADRISLIVIPSTASCDIFSMEIGTDGALTGDGVVGKTGAKTRS